MSAADCDLLVVGLGPVGDVLAALARLRGLSVIAIDRSPGLHPHPRAAVIDDEIMRIFQMVGVADAAARDMRVVDRYQFLTAGREVLLDFPLAAEGRFGWAESYALHQPTLEAVLRDRLATLGVDVRCGVAFTGLEQDATGVTVTTDAGAIRARYAVGCDGAASPVRQAIGAGLFDYGFDEPWLVLDTRIGDAHALPIVTQQICDPRRPLTHIAMNHGRYRWEFMLKPDETLEAVTTDASIRGLLSPWIDADHVTVERKAVYRFHALVAERWRAGRVLLAGDAAHQMPPFAGQGMCSGIRDAANLAWKLAAVIRDGAPDTILESYQAEREPHVRAIIETAVEMGRTVCLQDEAAAAGRDAAMLARKAAGEQDVSIAYPDLQGGLLTATPRAGALFPQPVADGVRLDTVLGDGAVLIGRGVQAGGIRILDPGDAALAPFVATITAWLAEAGAPAVLIRPDRHVFGTGEATSLVEAWRAQFGTSVPA